MGHPAQETLLRFFVWRVSVAPLAVPAQFHAVRNVFLVLAGVVISMLALAARQRDLFLRHHTTCCKLQAARGGVQPGACLISKSR